MDQQCSLDYELNKMLETAAEIGAVFNRGNAVGWQDERKQRLQELYRTGSAIYRPAFDHLIDTYCERYGITREFLGLTQSED